MNSLNKLPIVIAPDFFTNFLPHSLILKKLEKKGHNIIFKKNRFLSFCCAHTQAVALSKLVDETLEKYKTKKCNIIGISLGGIVAYYYLHELGGAEKVKIFIAIGSPFYGIWTTFCGISAPKLIAPNFWKILPNSPLINYLLKKPKLDNVKFFTFSGTENSILPYNSSQHPQARNLKPFSCRYTDLCILNNEKLLAYINFILITQ